MKLGELQQLGASGLEAPPAGSGVSFPALTDYRYDLVSCHAEVDAFDVEWGRAGGFRLQDE